MSDDYDDGYGAGYDWADAVNDKQIADLTAALEKANNEMRSVDDTLARRDALSNESTRIAKIEKCISVAKQADDLKQQLTAANEKVRKLEQAGEVEYQRAESIEFNKRWFQEQLIAKDMKVKELEADHNNVDIVTNFQLAQELAAANELVSRAKALIKCWLYDTPIEELNDDDELKWLKDADANKVE